MCSAPVFECRRVPETRGLGFCGVSGTISGQTLKLTGKIRPFEFTFLSPRSCTGVHLMVCAVHHKLNAGGDLAEFSDDELVVIPLVQMRNMAFEI